ncbi:MAG: cytochrome c3 family protein [Candidatus Brocadiales bacterium]|nr:cytochrome c3 family protein [Candidatus Bathyanammoxibius amoris]
MAEEDTEHHHGHSHHHGHDHDDDECGCLRTKAVNWVKENKKTVGIGLVIFLAVFMIGNLKMYHYSETVAFCGKLCHEMDIHYTSFMESKHHNEHVHNCHECHVGAGLAGFLHAKLSDGTHDTIEHLKGTFSDGRIIEVAEDSIPIINSNCVRCHSEEYTKDKTHVPTVLKSTRKIGEGVLKQILCVECHAGLVHPHMPGDLFKAYTEMKKSHPKAKIEPIGTYKDVECLGCHKNTTPEVVKEWTNGRHAEKGVTCDGCHGNDHSVIKERSGHVTGATCAQCHEKAYNEFKGTKHIQGRVVAVLGGEELSTKLLSMYLCKDCHRFGMVRPWDETGEDCGSCHMGHVFSKEQASKAGACEKCHTGGAFPDHSALDMSANSLHGQFIAKWAVRRGRAPACQECHGTHKSHNFEKASVAPEPL